MLVLTRKKDEEILVGENIVVRVLKVSGSHVSIGIGAPKNVKIFRDEIVGADYSALVHMNSGEQTNGN